MFDRNYVSDGEYANENGLYIYIIYIKGHL